MKTKKINQINVVITGIAILCIMFPYYGICKDSAIIGQQYPLYANLDQQSLLSAVDNPDEIHFGIHYAFNSRWILNQNTYGQFGGKTLAYKTDWGSAYGITAGYDFKGKFGLQTGFTINPLEGQQYHDVLSHITYDRKVSFEYYHIPLLFRLRGNMGNTKNPIMMCFSIGGQYGMLQSATDNVTINGILATNTDIKDRINKGELSLVMNIESDFYLCSFYI